LTDPEHAIEAGAQLIDRLRRQRVVHPVSVASIADHAGRPQRGEMVADQRLRQPQQIDQLTDAQLPPR
jgi:hypothetical protein